MDFSKRNKKVALNRWKKTHESDRARIRTSPTAIKHKATICGFLAGDGNLCIREKESNYLVKFFPDDVIMMDCYLKAVHYVYGKISSIRIRDNVYYLSLTSKVLTKDITNLASFGLKSWNLPYELFSVKGTKEAWLRGFFSAEAYVGDKSIKVQTVNKEGMLKVSELLSELGIEHRVYNYIPKNKRHSEVSIIMILKKEARKKFLEKVGFWHSKKTKKLRKTLNL